MRDTLHPDTKLSDNGNDSSPRRQVHDRRRQPTPPISKYTLRGRRMRARRQEETGNYYVDRFERRYLYVTAAVIIMSMADAFLTLHFLEYGGKELNPLMLFFIRQGEFPFLLIKLSITCAAVFILLIHKTFHIFGGLKVCCIMYTVFVGYFILILYEVYPIIIRCPPVAGR